MNTYEMNTAAHLVNSHIGITLAGAGNVLRLVGLCYMAIPCRTVENV